MPKTEKGSFLLRCLFPVTVQGPAMQKACTHARDENWFCVVLLRTQKVRTGHDIDAGFYPRDKKVKHAKYAYAKSRTY